MFKLFGVGLHCAPPRLRGGGKPVLCWSYLFVYLPARLVWGCGQFVRVWMAAAVVCLSHYCIWCRISAYSHKKGKNKDQESCCQLITDDVLHAHIFGRDQRKCDCWLEYTPYGRHRHWCTVSSSALQGFLNVTIAYEEWCALGLSALRQGLLRWTRGDSPHHSHRTHPSGQPPSVTAKRERC